MSWYDGGMMESALGWTLAILLGLQVMTMTAVMVLLLVDRRRSSEPHG